MKYYSRVAYNNNQWQDLKHYLSLGYKFVEADHLDFGRVKVVAVHAIPPLVTATRTMPNGMSTTQYLNACKIIRIDPPVKMYGDGAKKSIEKTVEAFLYSEGLTVREGDTR